MILFNKLVMKYNKWKRNQKSNIIMKDIAETKSLIDNKNKKILFGYVFSYYDNCRYHDYLLSQALRIRGAEVIPVACGGLQESQCSYFGGIWAGYNDDEKHNQKLHKNNCSECIKKDQLMWKKWGGIEPIYAKQAINDEEKNKLKDIIDNLEIVDYKNWEYRESPIGKWSLDVYKNNLLIARENVDASFEKAMREYAFNIILLVEASYKIIEETNPDIIYSNDSFYYPGAILECIAKIKKIPFYNGYGFGRKNTYSYAMNEPVIAINLDNIWKSYSKYNLSDKEDELISKFLKERKYGKDMPINTANPKEAVLNVDEKSIIGKIDSELPTALLTTNVSWDAAALNKELQFSSMKDWVIETVQYFAMHPEWQLIVKAHPAEVSKMLPEASERIIKEIIDFYSGILPKNVVLIDGNAPISVYDLYPIINVGIVYTSTTGLEMATAGIPVIVAGKAHYQNKGFTFDSQSKEEYFNLIMKLQSTKLNKEETDNIVKDSKKFFYLYYYRYLLPNNWYNFEYLGEVKLNIKSGIELMPGKSETLDYICDSILNGKMIFSENRMPPNNRIG